MNCNEQNNTQEPVLFSVNMKQETTYPPSKVFTLSKNLKFYRLLPQIERRQNPFILIINKREDRKFLLLVKNKL